MSIFNDKHYIWFRDLLVNEKLQIDIDQIGQLLAAFTKDNKDFDPDIILSPFRNGLNNIPIKKSAKVIKFPIPSVNLNIESWIEIYDPVPNMFNSETSYLTVDSKDGERLSYSFESYGFELDFVEEQSNNHIWTLVDSENEWEIYSGFVAINRIAYFVTAVPWSNDMVINYDIED